MLGVAQLTLLLSLVALVRVRVQSRQSDGSDTTSTIRCNNDSSWCVLRHVSCCGLVGEILSHGNEDSGATGPPFSTQEVDRTQPTFDLEPGRQFAAQRIVTFAKTREALD